MIIRWLLPITIPLLVCLGGLKLFWERNHWISNEFGVAFIAVSNLTIVSASVLWPWKFIRRLVGEQKLSENFFAWTGKRYQEIFDDVGDAILICEPEGRLIEVNRASCERPGYGTEKFREMSIKDVCMTSDVNAMRKLPGRVRTEGRLVYDAFYAKSDGTATPMEVSSQMTDYGGSPAVLSVARDGEERSRMAKQLYAKMRDLESFNKIAVGREVTMAELKKKVQELEARLAKSRPVAGNSGGERISGVEGGTS